MRGRLGLWAWIINGALFLFALTTIFPFVWIIYNSLKPQAEFARDVYSLPTAPTFAAYQAIFDTGTVYVAMRNTAFYSVTTTVLIVFLAFVVGYVLARFEFPGKRLLYYTFILGILVPVPALLVPIFLQYRSVGFLDNQYTLLPPYVAFGLSTAVILMESYIRSVPVELDEAAYIDGGGIFTLMFRIVFPICRPIVSTVALLSFLGSWNEFAFASTLLRRTDYKPATLWLTTFVGEHSVNYPGMMAGMFIMTLPIVTLYLVFRERIVEGFAGGAVKL